MSLTSFNIAFTGYLDLVACLRYGCARFADLKLKKDNNYIDYIYSGEHQTVACN